MEELNKQNVGAPSVVDGVLYEVNLLQLLLCVCLEGDTTKIFFI